MGNIFGSCSQVDVETDTCFNVKKCVCCSINTTATSNTLNKQFTGMYTENEQTIVILNCDIPKTHSLIDDTKDLHDTDIYVFDDELKFISCQGKNIMKLGTDVKNNDDMIGKKIEDVIPTYMWKFMKPIYEETLNGKHLKLMTMFGGKTWLVYTLPLFNEDKKNIGGILFSYPYKSMVIEDIDRFVQTPQN